MSHRTHQNQIEHDIADDGRHGAVHRSLGVVQGIKDLRDELVDRQERQTDGIAEKRRGSPLGIFRSKRASLINDLDDGLRIEHGAHGKGHRQQRQHVDAALGEGADLEAVTLGEGLIELGVDDGNEDSDREHDDRVDDLVAVGEHGHAALGQARRQHAVHEGVDLGYAAP